MDAIFKAMADPARRDLLDALRHEDGQTLSQLGQRFEMTRFGVMKHLGVLEDAGLVTTLKRGRYKYHYLNPVPLQEALDRWIAPMAQGPARGILALKAHLERRETLTLTTFIAASPARIRAALQSADAQAAFSFMADTVTRDGAALHFFRGGAKMLTIEELAETETTLHARFSPHWADIAPSDLTHRFEPEGAHTKLTLIHEAATPEMADGWGRTLAGLKTYLETGTSPKFRASPPAVPARSDKETSP
ncbi:MAG: helix-turn-helix domain-containing protein [Pseudomonadota bacterium]